MHDHIYKHTFIQINFNGPINNPHIIKLISNALPITPASPLLPPIFANKAIIKILHNSQFIPNIHNRVSILL